MNHLRWVRFAVLALFLGFGTAEVSAQGLTTAGINGRVSDPAGNPVGSAQISVRNSETGVATGVIANANGIYFIANLEPGGPYTVEVSSIGFETQRRDDIMLSLGQNYRIDWVLSEQAVEIQGIEVTVPQNEIFSTERTGQQTIVTNEQIDDLPTLTRNFTELATLSPLASANSSQGTPIMGGNNRLNQIQVDGAVNNDAFGLADSGVPGGQANGKPISQDAIKEFQIMVAPYDVRQSGFTGGLINAVTKSGTNDFHGSLFANFKNESLQQETIVFNESEFSNSDFTNFMISGTLGGPIVRDKAHFFAAVEVENRDFPNAVGIENVQGLDPSSITRVGQIAEQQYGLDFGRATVYKNKNPAANLFGRVDWQLNPSNRLSVKYTYANADLDDSPSRGTNSNFFESESATYDFTNNTHTAVAELFTQIGGAWSNDALVTFQAIRDKRAPAPEFSYATTVVDVPDDPVDDGTTIQFGAERFSHANRLDQNIFQFTNNVTGNLGAHRPTFGLNLERWGFDNLFADRSLGQWEFDSIEDFQAGTASFYALRVPHPSLGSGAIEDTSAKFAYWKLGLYGQDEWQVNNELSVTYGLRVDVPFTGDEPRNNNEFSTAFGFPTTEVPSGNPVLQPRVGFNWQPRTRERSQLRGGVGVFAGRPAFVWMANAYGNTGRETVELRCFGSNAPAYEPRNPPTSCVDGSGAAAARASIAVVDPDFKFPSEFRANLAYDREFADDWRVTVEGIYSKSINSIVVEELNSGQAPVGTTNSNEGVGSRSIYGERIVSSDDPFRPAQVDGDNFNEVVRMTNSSKGYSYALITELQKSFGWLDLYGGYAYRRAFDIQSFSSSRAISNYGFNPVGASAALDDREATPSNWDRPHRLTGVGTVRWGLANVGPGQVSLIYKGESGKTYMYVYDGDVNGDGFAGLYSSSRTNDLIYVPSNSSELAFRSADDERLFNELVALDSCLQDARGTIMERNSCRAPFEHFLDLRIVQGVSTPQGTFDIVLDVFNVLNLLNSDWGIHKGPVFETNQLLRTRGRENDDPNGRILFTYDGFRATDSSGTQRAVLPYSLFSSDSRYQIQLGVRYRF